jgi:hypothetical protein
MSRTGALRSETVAARPLRDVIAMEQCTGAFGKDGIAPVSAAYNLLT